MYSCERCMCCAPSTIHMRCIARKFIICYLARIIIVFLCTCEIRIRVCNPTVDRRHLFTRCGTHTPSASDCNGNSEPNENSSQFSSALSSLFHRIRLVCAHILSADCLHSSPFLHVFISLFSSVSRTLLFFGSANICETTFFLLSLSFRLLLAFSFVYLLRVYILTNNTIIRCPSCACENQFSKNI